MGIIEKLAGTPDSLQNLKTKIRTTLYLDREIYEAFKKHCETHDLSPSRAVNEFMREVIERASGSGKR
jgi:hypothetical protein